MIPEMICDLLSSIVLFFCGIQSFRAIQTTNSSDDKQWLTFWLLYTIFSLVTGILDFVSFVIPFYEEIKLGFVTFVGLFGGAGQIYPMLEPLLLKGDEVAKKYEAQAKVKAEEMKTKAAEKVAELKSKTGSTAADAATAAATEKKKE